MPPGGSGRVGRLPRRCGQEASLKVWEGREAPRRSGRGREARLKV